MEVTVNKHDRHAIVNGTHPNPFAVLGIQTIPYKQRKAIAIRAFLPDAVEAYVYDFKRRTRYPMTRVHEDGLFEVIFSRRRNHFPYQLETIDRQGNQRTFFDPYGFSPVLAKKDLKHFHSGQHYTVYEHFGAHQIDVNGVSGTVFAVWAPNAKQVRVTGDFNDWNDRRYVMRLHKPYGVWELFLPGVGEGAQYQYKISTASGEVLTKIDPYGFHGELHPDNEMSVVTTVDQFAWTDQQWMQQRIQQDPLTRPISTYEVHLGSWLRAKGDNRFLTYRELAQTLIPYVKELGFTYIELLPIAEHPYYPSWGYQVTGYYAPTSRYGRPEDLMYFVNECHRQGIGVIIDWVPAHFPKDEFSLGGFDGTDLYEHEDPRMAEHKDWGTLIFDYGKHEVKNFLIANAVFWCEKYHIDGIRVDAVASMLYLDYSRQEGEWVPNKYGGRENLEAIAFLKEFNAVMHKRFSGVLTIAEESTSWLGVTYPAYLGGLDFTLKWNLGWMNDMLHYLSHKPMDRKYVHTMVPFALLYAFHEHFVLELSHDEVVHGKGSLVNKMPGDEWHKFANLRVLFGFMFGHPGKKLLFMGNEFGQWREWNHDKGLDWYLLEHTPHQGLQRYVRDLNHLYVSEPALYADQLKEQGFAWIDHHDFHNSVIVFLRKIHGEPSQCVIFICNFIPATHKNYRIGVPFPGHYHELLNSDDVVYGGSNVGNLDGCEAEPTPWQRQPYSLTLTLPPLSVLILKPTEPTTEPSQSQRTLSVPKKSETSIPKTSGKVSTKSVEKPVLPSPVISEGISEEGALPPALNAGIHQRGKKAVIPDIPSTEHQDASVQSSRVARPQGSKMAILSEEGIVREEKKSSG